MATMNVDEKRLKELVKKAVEEHLKLTLEDMEEVRRSPAAAIVRLETRLEGLERYIEKNMATREEVAMLRGDITDLRSRVENIEENMATKGDLGRLQVENDNLKENMATKGDLGKIQVEIDDIKENMATKADLGKIQVEIDDIKENMATKADLANLRVELIEYVGNVAASLSERIAKLETGQKLVFGLLLAMLAMLIKLVFFP